jgi:ABC-type glycerol-3-phosphate transport system substrate-binding protein
MAIPKASTNVNAAKLMLDFILSHDGQVAFGKGGLTPYRPDVKPSEVPRYTYSSVVQQTGGENNVILVNYDPRRRRSTPRSRMRPARPAPARSARSGRSPCRSCGRRSCTA